MPPIPSAPTLASEPISRASAWSAYWLRGGADCLPGADAQRSGDPLRAFWKAWISTLPAGRHRAVDLGCGNGALSRLLREEVSAGVQLEVDAVDIAHLAPDQGRDDPGLRFHPGVRIEALGFPDRCFDAAVSQYGFEYADPGRAIAQIARVLRPGGRIALVVHAADSLIAQRSAEEVRQHARLSAPGGLLDCAAAVIPWLWRLGQGDDLGRYPEAGRAREAFNRAVAALQSLAAPSPERELSEECLRAVTGILATARGTPDAAIRKLARYRFELEAAALRSREMLEHALTPDGIERLIRAFREHWPDTRTRHSRIVHPEGVLGWGITLGP